MSIAVAIQASVLFCSGALLDGGMLAQICWMALVPYWAGVLLLVWRRPRQPTRLDLALVRIGYLPLIIITMFLVPLIWHLRGVL